MAKDEKWRVADGPPPVERQTAAREPAPDVAQVVKLAVDSGRWVTRLYDDKRQAETAWRRIRYHVRNAHPDRQVRSRKVPHGTGGKVELWIMIEGKKA